MKRSVFKRIGAVVVSACLVTGALAATGCAGSSPSSSSKSSTSASTSASASAAASDKDLMSGVHHAVITVDGYDPINVELDANAAPISVTNFVDLANDGYYNGLNFYRIVDGFCLQGGTKGNNASGNDSSLTPIKGEFSQNGVSNPLADNFEYGTIAMARTSVPDSATSTFFITLGDNKQVGASLDGKYAAFGKVDAKGMKQVEKIVADYLKNVDEPNMGAITDQSKQPVITSIEIVD